MTATTARLQETWRYQGWLTSDEVVEDGAVDSAGNLILAGYVNRTKVGLENSTSAANVLAVKVSGSMGVEVWTWTHSSELSTLDIINGVAVDSKDNVILGGYTEIDGVSVNSNKQRNMTVVKLDGATGDKIWRYQDAADDLESSTGRFGYDSTFIEGVAVDANDNVFLVGTMTNDLVPGDGTVNDIDWFVRKLDGDTAAVLWTVREGSTVFSELTKGIKVDLTGDLVIAGNTGDDDSTITVKKLSGVDGEVLWEFTRISSTAAALSSVDVDGDGNVYVAGSEGAEDLQGTNAEHPIVLKLDGRSGAGIWNYSGDTAFSGRSVFHAVAVDSIAGYIVGAGWLELTSTYDMIAVVLDSETGDELSVYQNGTAGSDGIKFAGFDEQGHLLFGGTTNGEWSQAAGGSDVFAVKFETLPESNMTVPALPATPSPTRNAPAPDIVPAYISPTAPPSRSGDIPVSFTLAPTWDSSPSSEAFTLNTTTVALIAGGEVLLILLILLGLCECCGLTWASYTSLCFVFCVVGGAMRALVRLDALSLDHD